jgi:hypothetical protein
MSCCHLSIVRRQIRDAASSAEAQEKREQRRESLTLDSCHEWAALQNRHASSDGNVPCHMFECKVRHGLSTWAEPLQFSRLHSSHALGAFRKKAISWVDRCSFYLLRCLQPPGLAAPDAAKPIKRRTIMQAGDIAKQEFDSLQFCRRLRGKKRKFEF